MAFGIAIITASFQAMKATRSNPLKSLSAEWTLPTFHTKNDAGLFLSLSLLLH